MRKQGEGVQSPKGTMRLLFPRELFTKDLVVELEHMGTSKKSLAVTNQWLDLTGEQPTRKE